MSAENRIEELRERGFCVLKAHFDKALVKECLRGFWPTLLDYLDRYFDEPNRGLHRHFLAMPFEPPCFAPEFFFDEEVLSIARGVMGERFVADQWGCDVALRGSTYQSAHIDYQRPLFPEIPELLLPPYMLVVNFGLSDITPADGPIEIAPGTHRLARDRALLSFERGAFEMQTVTLEPGDVLIRHPWALHRGTPNTTDTPRTLVSIRYVRHWYIDDSREVKTLPRSIWQSLTTAQQSLMRFPVGD